MLFIDSRMGSTNRFIYCSKLNKYFTSDHKYLIPATKELIQLNNIWQQMIKDEKDRRRNVCMIETTEGELIEQNDTDINEFVEGIENNMLSNFGSDNSVLNFQCIVPVTKITIPNETTREYIAQQYTLNKNQKAAYMIITGHLDGLDKLDEGIAIKLKI